MRYACLLLVPLLACGPETSSDDGNTTSPPPNCGLQQTSEIEVPRADVEAVLDADGAIPADQCSTVCDSPFWDVTSCMFVEFLDIPAQTGTTAGDSGSGTADSGTAGDAPPAVVSCTYTELCI